MPKTKTHIEGLGYISITKNRGIKNMTIRVSGGGHINLSLPWYVPKSAGMAFVHAKKTWIKHQIANNPKPLNKDEWLELDKKARQTLPVRLEELASKHGYKYRRIRFSSAGTRWGSYSEHGTISLNIQLAILPDELVDYVLVHELVHTKHLNHGPAFWREVEEILPSYKILKKRLREYPLQRRP